MPSYAQNIASDAKITALVNVISILKNNYHISKLCACIHQFNAEPIFLGQYQVWPKSGHFYIVGPTFENINELLLLSDLAYSGFAFNKVKLHSNDGNTIIKINFKRILISTTDNVALSPISLIYEIQQAANGALPVIFLSRPNI